MSPLHPDPSKDSTLSHATNHPLRREFLQLLSHRPSISAAEAVEEIEDAPGTLERCSYHLRVLDLYELVEAIGAPTEDGLRYRLTSRGRLAASALSFGAGGA